MADFISVQSNRRFEAEDAKGRMAANSVVSRATEEIRRAPPRKLQVTRHARNQDEELQQAGKQEEGSGSTICRPAWTTYEHPFVLLLRGPCLSKAQAYLGTSALQYNSPQ